MNAFVPITRPSGTRLIPETADQPAINAIIASATARIAPNGCVIKEVNNDPSAACAKAVVQPQVAQGNPVAITKPHSGSFNCVCVPMPAALGVNVAAKISGDEHANAKPSAPTRGSQPSFSSVDCAIWSGCIAT